MSSGQAKVYFPQGATEMVVASGGRVTLEAGSTLSAVGVVNMTPTAGTINLSAAVLTLPANLGRGYIPLVARGVKTTATASGIVTAWTTAVQPNLKTFEVASGVPVYTWTSAAGNANPLIFEPVRIPDDFSTGGPLRVVYTGRTSGAATNDINVIIRSGTATANLGATGALSSTPTERTISVASGSLTASGWIGVTIFPSAHATGSVALYNQGISYQRKTS